MRSVTVGIPAFVLRRPASGFHSSPTGTDVGCPFRILSVSSWLCSFNHGNASSIVIPSTPSALLVCLHSCKLCSDCPYSVSYLKMSGSALSLSFHIRLNERCALTYPLRSALSLQAALSLFSASICSFLLSGSYLRLLLIRPSPRTGSCSFGYYDLC